MEMCIRFKSKSFFPTFRQQKVILYENQRNRIKLAGSIIKRIFGRWGVVAKYYLQVNDQNEVLLNFYHDLVF